MFNHKSIILLMAVAITNTTHADLSANLAAAVDAPYLTFTSSDNPQWQVDNTTTASPVTVPFAAAILAIHRYNRE